MKYRWFITSGALQKLKKQKNIVQISNTEDNI